MMTMFTHTRRLSLGFRYRCLLAFVVLLAALLSGVTAPRAEAPIFGWAKYEGGTVEVEGSTTVTLKAGEFTSYRLRLTKPLPVVDGDRQEGWWVRVHVDSAVRIDGYYDPNNPDARRDNSALSWVPSVGWQFDPDDWDLAANGEPLRDESKWRTIHITAHKDLDTPVTFTHEVWDQQSNCPPDLKGLGTVSVSSNANPNPGQNNDNNLNPGQNNDNNLNNNDGTSGPPGDGNGGTPGGPVTEQLRQLSSNATLSDLVLSHGTTVVPLTPGFMPETKEYTATVDSSVTQVTVTPTPNHAGAQIMYLDGDDRMLADANDGEHGFQVDLPVGDTMIRVKVTAEDGTMDMYTVTVSRAPSSDATLRDLVVSHGTNVVRLSPRFRPGTMMYRTEVDSTVTQVTVTPMPNHAGAQVMYLDGDDRMLTDTNNTERGFQVELPVVGDNVIKVKVTAEDGGTMKTYTVTVTRVVGLARNREGVGHEWLARFARTVGTQVVNVVGERFVAPRQPGLAGQVAGHDLSRLVRASVQPDDAPDSQVRPGAGLAEYAPGRSNSRLLTARDFLSGTSFTLTMGQEDGLSAALWGRGAVMRFDGRDGDLLLDGEVSTGMLGVDYSRGAVTGGLLVSLNRGQGDYQSPTGDGELDSLLVGVYPYARVEISERISAWGLFGHGRGNVTLSPASQSPISTDIGLHMGALGVEGMLSDSSGPTGLDLTVKSDAMWVKIESDEAVGLDSTHAKVSRLRLMLEGVRVFEVAPGATLTPSGQIGLRHDEGDAETGFGLDMSAGIRYAAGRLTIEGTVRTLVAHEDSAYEEWGASGAIRMTPDALGRGLSLTLAPAWGNTASKAEQLWAGQAPTGLATTGSTLPGTRLTAELGYGMVPADYRGILTPYAGFSLGNGSSQIYRTGARWQVAPETTLEFEASRGTAALSPVPVNSVMLRAAWRW